MIVGNCVKMTSEPFSVWGFFVFTASNKVTGIWNTVHKFNRVECLVTCVFGALDAFVYTEEAMRKTRLFGRHISFINFVSEPKIDYATFKR